MRLLFVYGHAKPDYWKDGLWRALKELEKKIEITYYNLDLDKKPEGIFDFALGWGGFNSPANSFIVSYNGRKGLCIGGNTNKPSLDVYDVLFYETDWVRRFLNLDKLKKGKIVKAFGINNEIFYPHPNIAKVWDYLGVGVFANWKRWDKMAEKKGKRLVIGEYQDANEVESLLVISSLMKGGVTISNRVLPEELVNYYCQAKTVYVPADIYGGGERVVLEARSCGCKVEVEEDNPKLKELLSCPVPTFQDYAQKIYDCIL
jgi:hypothetical protein